MKLQSRSRSRLLFYSSGGSRKYHVFEEATLDWRACELAGSDYKLPILCQFAIVTTSTSQQKVYGIGGLKEESKVSQDPKLSNRVVTEKLTRPCRDTFEVHLNLKAVQPKKDMKLARAMFAVATSVDQVYVVGGIDNEKNEIAECEVFDCKQNMWSQLPSLQRPRSSASLVYVNVNLMYVFGGFPLGNNSIEMFTDQKWQSINLAEGDHLVNPFWSGYHISENYDGKIFFFGGGQKYNDVADFYEFSAADFKMEKMKLALPKEDRFFYNS